MNISNKYTIVGSISQGNFGKIYKGQHIRTKEYVAIKVEPNNSETNTLKNETRIYQYLGKTVGFPQVKWFGIDDQNNYMVLELLGSSLKSLIKKYYALSLKTVLLLGIQMIQRIQSLHTKYLIHRDIKPDNFLIGLNDKQDVLHLIDVGFCKRYIYGTAHIEWKRISTIIGTPNFVSINVHKGCEPSRRDDLESIIYVMMFCLFGTLHWIDESSDISLSNTKIMECKENLFKIEDIPAFFKDMLVYVRGLLFEQTPNYLFLISILETELSKVKSQKHFEWIPL